MTAGLVSFPPRCRVVRLVFGSAFFPKPLRLFHQLAGRGFEKNVVGAGSVRLKIITETIDNRGQMACFQGFQEECH